MQRRLFDASKGGNSELVPNALIFGEICCGGFSSNPSVTSAVLVRSTLGLSDVFGASSQLAGFGGLRHD